MIGFSQLVIDYFGDDGVPTSAVEWEDMDQPVLAAFITLLGDDCPMDVTGSRFLQPLQEIASRFIQCDGVRSLVPGYILESLVSQLLHYSEELSERGAIDCGLAPQQSLVLV